MYDYICSKCDCEEEKKKQPFKFKTAADGQLFINFNERTRQVSYR